MLYSLSTPSSSNEEPSYPQRTGFARLIRYITVYKDLVPERRGYEYSLQRKSSLMLSSVILLFLVFGVGVSLAEKNFAVILPLGITAVLALAGFVWTRVTDSGLISLLINSAWLICLGSIFLMSDGSNTSYLYWFLLYPPLVMYCLGVRWGIFLIFWLFLALLLIFFGPISVPSFIEYYPLTSKLRFLIALFGSGFFSGLSERFRYVAYRSLHRAQKQLELQNVMLEKTVKERTKEVTDTQDALIASMASLAERRDSTTGSHLKRVENYMVELARHLQKRGDLPSELSKASLSVLGKSALLHDIGKVGVPDYILLKPGKLSLEEFEIIKSHTIHGLDAITVAETMLSQDNNFLLIARQIAYGHHERWDGTGYPQRLKGDDIPFSARMMAVVDVYDALRTERPYKAAMEHGQAVIVIIEGSGTHFDPLLVEAFNEIHNKFSEISS